MRQLLLEERDEGVRMKPVSNSHILARYQAIGKVKYAVKKGVLPSLRTNEIKCSDCPRRATCYDHRDYDLPLDVSPVCQSCNVRRGNAKSSPLDVEGYSIGRPVAMGTHLHKILKDRSIETGKSIAFLAERAVLRCYGGGTEKA